MTAEEILSLRTAKYLFQIRTLQERIKKVEWACTYDGGDDDEIAACPWCLSHLGFHENDCEAFTPEGEVK